MKAVVRLSWGIISALADMVIGKMDSALDEHRKNVLSEMKKNIRRRMKYVNYDTRAVLRILQKKTNRGAD
jgi:hypothetical protein